MSYDKVVDSTQLDAAMTYTAGRIRAKTGDTNQMTWDSAKGFGDAVDAITGGSSVPQSDTREVYQGTRPAEWLRLPDYDKVEDNTAYFLFELFPYGTNKISLQFRTAGIATITAGVVSNGEFIPFENDNVVSMQGAYYGWKEISRTFNYADYDTLMSDGTKQIVVQFQTTSALNRIGFGGSSNGGAENRGIRDIIIHKITLGEGYSCFNQMSQQRGCLYYYAIGAGALGYPVYLRTLTYIQHADGVMKGSMSNAMQLVKVLGTYKKINGDYNEFANCVSLIELTYDISDWIKANNTPFSSCYSLRKLLFTNCETMTSFPVNIDLTGTALEVDAVLAFFNTLPNISTSDTRTITLKNTPAATAGIPDETLAIATNKGWTVVTA
nr:MAG TPA: hypothetical protein [Caudoviricetes sp.]